jgi:hypothetical protein
MTKAIEDDPALILAAIHDPTSLIVTCYTDAPILGPDPCRCMRVARDGSVFCNISAAFLTLVRD